MSPYAPLLAALVALLAGLTIGKAWERYKLRGGTWIDRRRARQSPHYILGLNFLVANQIDLAIEKAEHPGRAMREQQASVGRAPEFRRRRIVALEQARNEQSGVESQNDAPAHISRGFARFDDAIESVAAATS